jgi:glycosyltransferase involved in cell wall biosynthesis
MAMGRACVATDIGENRVDLDDGKAGALAAPNPRALADGIDGLAHSPAIRDAFGKRARARALQKYDWKVLASFMSAALIGHEPASAPSEPQSPALR